MDFSLYPFPSTFSKALPSFEIAAPIPPSPHPI